MAMSSSIATSGSNIGSNGNTGGMTNNNNGVAANGAPAAAAGIIGADGMAVPGKLKDIAIELFQRAYGLAGRRTEDHEALQTEAIRRTGCSPKAFQELIYGHSYPQMLGALRATVSGYKPKQPRQRTPSERGRGSLSNITPFMPQHGGHMGGGIEGLPGTMNNGGMGMGGMPMAMHHGGGGMMMQENKMDGMHGPSSPTMVHNRNNNGAPPGNRAYGEWPVRRDGGPPMGPVPGVGPNGAPPPGVVRSSPPGNTRPIINGAPPPTSGGPVPMPSSSAVTSPGSGGNIRNDERSLMMMRSGQQLMMRPGQTGSGTGGGLYRGDIMASHHGHGLPPHMMPPPNVVSGGNGSNDSSPTLTSMNAASHAPNTNVLPPGNRYQPAPSATSAAYHSYGPSSSSYNNTPPKPNGAPQPSSQSYHPSSTQPIGLRSHQIKSGAVPSSGYPPFVAANSNTGGSGGNDRDALISAPAASRFTNGNSSLLTAPTPNSNNNSNSNTGNGGSNPGSAQSSPALFPSIVGHNGPLLHHLQLPGQALANGAPIQQAESPNLSPRTLRSLLNMGTISLDRNTPSPLPIFGRDQIDTASSLLASVSASHSQHDNESVSSAASTSSSTKNTKADSATDASSSPSLPTANDASAKDDTNESNGGAEAEPNGDESSNHDRHDSVDSVATSSDDHSATATATDVIASDNNNGDEHSNEQHHHDSDQRDEVMHDNGDSVHDDHDGNMNHSMEDSKRESVGHDDATVTKTTSDDTSGSDTAAATSQTVSSSSSASLIASSMNTPLTLDYTLLTHVVHDTRFIQALALALCFSLARAVLHSVGVYIVIGSNYVAPLLTCVIIGCMIPLLMFLYTSYRSFITIAELPSLLAAAIESYTESWEFLAIEDQAQLLAALHQIKLLNESLILTLSGDTTALTNSVKTLDFLHSAHKNLMGDLGSTPLVSQLISTLRVIRELLGRYHLPLQSLQSFNIHMILSTMLPLAIILLVGDGDNGSFGNWFVTMAVSFVLAILSLFILSICASSNIASVKDDTSKHISIGGMRIGVGIGNGVSVSVTPLLYLRSRLLDKEREVLLPSSGNHHANHTNHHSSSSNASSHAPHARDFDDNQE